MVCGVVADSREHAKLGAAAVKIHYQDLPDPVFTVEVSTHCGGGLMEVVVMLMMH